ncbi:MAG: glycosyl hydrolase family 18 protein [Dehalococcoidales bacterium]|nr:glycosyl hydrolase family 18 protein [Dehalococcoidales bacterium]
MTVNIIKGANTLNVSMTPIAGVTHRLNVSVQGQGTTNPAPGGYDIPDGQTVNLSATPAAGWTFRTWTWPGNDPDYSGWPDNPISWPMTEPLTLIAVFDQTGTPTGPVANFNANPMSGQAPLTVAFTDTSTGNITGYLWNFGDGSTSTTRNPSNVFNTAAQYSVSLTVTGPDGSNTTTKVINATSEPIPPTGMLVPAYLGTSIPSGLPMSRITEGIWEYLQPRTPSDMTLVEMSSSLSTATAFINACHNAGKLASFSVFLPWGTSEGDFTTAITNASLRSQFANNIAAVFNSYNFDAVNLDLECDNKSNVTREMVTALIRELYGLVTPMGKTISATENGSPQKVTMNTEAADYLEWIGLMDYDVAQPTWYGTLNDVVTDLALWASAGFPRNKMVTGINLAARDSSGSWYRPGYAGIISNYNPPPSANSAGPYYYGGYDLTVQKAQYVKNNDFGGVFCYYTQTDAFSDYRSLLLALQTGFS